MIRNREVFDQEFLPDDLHHRDGHINDLMQSLNGIPDPKRHEIVTIYGPSGSGKTTLARYVARRFQAEYPDLRVGYVDCIKYSTQTSALQHLTTQTHRHPTVPTSPTRRFDTLAAIRDTTDPLLVIIDELDFLEEPQLIHALHGTHGVWIIGIALDEIELLADLHAGIRTRLQNARHLTLTAFTTTHLTDILQSRINHGLRVPEIVTPTAVQRIVTRANGNASDAIAILRACINQLDPDNLDPITPEIVERLQGPAKTHARTRSVDRLDTHPRMLFQLINADTGITGERLKHKYEQRASNPRSDRMRQNYLTQLQQYGLVNTTGQGRGTRYHAVTDKPLDCDP